MMIVMVMVAIMRVVWQDDAVMVMKLMMIVMMRMNGKRD